jgi:hypothetical protein
MKEGYLPSQWKSMGAESDSIYFEKPYLYRKTRYNYRVNKEQYFEVEGLVPPIISEEEF